MQINQLQPVHKSKGRKIVGRGGKKGTYSGRGGKGQTARAGRKVAPIIRELIKRYPKLKGYRRFVLERSIAVVNIDMLDAKAKDGQVINPSVLVSEGLIRAVKNKIPKVKILGKGKLRKKLIIENCFISKAAREAVEKAGGSVKAS